jgi:hypothetical protein
MLNLSILCTRCERNYSSCTDRSSENRCSSSGKKRDRVKLRNHQNWWFSQFQPPLNVNVLFCRFFSNLTQCMTKLRVQVLCFPDFTNISNTLLLLAASTTNYITFSNVEIFQNYFFQISFFGEEKHWIFKIILFVELKISKLINYFDRYVSKLPRYYDMLWIHETGITMSVQIWSNSATKKLICFFGNKAVRTHT